jgi:hypothetical protein
MEIEWWAVVQRAAACGSVTDGEFDSIADKGLHGRRFTLRSMVDRKSLLEQMHPPF